MAAGPSKKTPTGELLRDQVRKNDLPAAERTFAAICAAGSPDKSLDELMVLVDDATEVHRIVLVSRAYELIDFVGPERAHTLLRQSVHYCANTDKNASHVKRHQEVRDLLPRLLDEHKLLSKAPGTRPADDVKIRWHEETKGMIVSAPREFHKQLSDFLEQARG